MSRNRSHVDQMMNYSKSNSLRERCHSVIPGGSHTYAKGDDQFPEMSPGFIVQGQGCHVWDADGNEFVEYGMGLRSVTLGHGYKPVVEAAYQQMKLGNNFTRPSTIELECAEKLQSCIKSAEMVKFAKNGSDVTSAAVRLARAFTRRDKIAICAEHPFFSFEDWFIGSTAMSAGIPESIQKMTLKFHYNYLNSIQKLFEEYPTQIACVLLEPATFLEPQDRFLHRLQELCTQNGAILIFDEMITGFRWHCGGAQEYYGVTPDLSTFGKAIANGFSVSALCGKKEIMNLGGLNHDQEKVFLLSTTHGAESHSLAAAMETMNVYERENVVDHLRNKGERLADGVRKVIEKNQMNDFFKIMGHPSNLIFATRDSDKNPSQAFRTLFLQEMIQRGFITPSFVISFSHSEEDINGTIEAVDESLRVYKKALSDGVEKYLVGKPVKPVNRKFN
jgi:glutamate-1-semialdehyde 2,1-aminomutase